MVKIVRKEIEIDLDNETQARIFIKQLGQVRDGVSVQAEIQLPSDEKGSLIAKLRNPDITVGPSPLHPWWGVYREKGSRYIGELFIGSTWEEAFSVAEKWALKEMQKLISALSSPPSSNSEQCKGCICYERDVNGGGQ